MKEKLTRRAFLNRTFLGITAMGLAPLNVFRLGAQESKTVESWAQDASKYTFYMIGHAHIDPVWLWSWREGLSVVMSTFRAALDRMDENPEFIFTASSTLFYKWVSENDPALMQRIRKRIQEGRWCVVGGWWIEPDVNIPCGESLARQGLYGQRTIEQLTGKRAEVGFSPDAFGHSCSLPQILTQQGLKYYIFMRPMPHEKKLPANLFHWEGPDGSRIITYRLPITYSNSRSIRQRFERSMNELPVPPHHAFMSFYGAGDHGGGATKDNFRQIAELRTQQGAPKIVYSSPDRFFNVVKDVFPTLPVVKENLQPYGVGCYSVDSVIKKGNRQAEIALLNTEKLLALGKFGWSAHYPRTALKEAWEQVLFLQFHDSMSGTSQSSHTEIARQGHNFACNAAERARAMAMQKLEWQIPTEDPESEYLIAFNPHPWPTDTLLAYDLNIKEHAYPCDETGTPLPYQWTVGESQAESVKMLLFRTTLPALGYRQIRVRKGDPAQDPFSSAESKVKGTANSLENQWVKVTFSLEGYIGITDKKSGESLFVGGNSGCKAIVINDTSDTWGHDVNSYQDAIGCFGAASFKLLEDGPLRATMRVTSHYGDSILTIDWSLQADSHTLEANVSLDWHERSKLLKFSFPVAGADQEATTEIPYANCTRPLNQDEEPGQRWVDISGTRNGKRCGMSLINDAKSGYSFGENDLRVTVVRSPVYANHVPRKLEADKEYVWMDQGIQTFRMQLVPHQGGWQEAGTPECADRFCEGPIVTYQGIHGGTLPKTSSFMSIEGEGVRIGTVKLAEENGDLIVRCVESHGKRREATITIPSCKFKWSGTFNPYQIKTLRINPAKGTAYEVNLLEEKA